MEIFSNLDIYSAPTLSLVKSSKTFEPAKEDCKNHENGHVLLVVGYNITNKKDQYWIIKNSWGKHFGIDGYFHWRFGNWFGGCIKKKEMTSVTYKK